jgi:hypothetical protein
VPKANPAVVEMLATAMLAGDASVDAVCARLIEVLGQERRWFPPLARRYIATFRDRTRPREREVVRFLELDEGFHRVCEKHPGQLHGARWLMFEPAMQPVAKAVAWDVPAIATVEELAVWLRLSPAELAWFADLKTLGRRLSNSPRLQHYHYRIVVKPTGAVRLIESPKELMKGLQRRVLEEILNRVPAHAAVHGFVKARSIRTFAAPHAGRHLVLRLDLEDFFPSIRRARVQSIFRTLGYPEAVADLLGGLCTNVAPRAVLRNVPAELLEKVRRLYGQMHVPQGAPTSPALANVCAYRLDCRLAGLAEASGAAYTRYADDLAFSGAGAFERGVERFVAHAAAIALEEGFGVNHRKTRVMRRGVRQHLAGLVVNEKVSVPRAEFDRLKATLTNCVRHGAAAENRDGVADFRAHLQGRIAFVAMVQPRRGEKLRRIFEAIEWG